MPIFFTKKIAPSGIVGVWKIEESEDFFHDNMDLTTTEWEELQRIQHSYRRKEWLASRYLLHLLSGRTLRGACLKDAYGKPYLENSPFQISISHSHETAAVIAAPCLVGIDIQLLTPKIEKVAHKFLSTTEIQSIHPSYTLAHLHVYWGAKEALYKAYGKKELDFRNNIFVEPFEYVSETATLKGTVQKNDVAIDFQVYYHILEKTMLVYVLNAR